MHTQAQNSIPRLFESQNIPDPVALPLTTKAAELACRHWSRPLLESEDVVRIIRENTNFKIQENKNVSYEIVNSLERSGFTIHTILFESREGVWVPASLYVPKGEGPFPAVVNSHGHWKDGRRTDIAQQTAQLLASNGYVCLNMDAWGAGERGSEHTHEYHGSNLGASLMNVGETLLGLQLSDNRRGVDLLCTLPYVDTDHIGATGASGGGNQTMWLAATDDRIKAVVPVVSVGTFRSYVMNSNCVCELMPDGLTHLEESDVLAAVAPRALKMLTAIQDGNAAFAPLQMLKTYKQISGRFTEKQLAYELFNSGHDYNTDMQRSMLNWFDTHLKPDSTKQQDLTISPLVPVEDLSVFKGDKALPSIVTTKDYIRIAGHNLRKRLEHEEHIDRKEKQTELESMLYPGQRDIVLRRYTYNASKGWEPLLLETRQAQFIPLLYRLPKNQNKGFKLIISSKGKQQIDAVQLSELEQHGYGIIVFDLYAVGERSSQTGDHIDGQLPRFHTVSRASLWFGEPMMGIWSNEIAMVIKEIQQLFPDQPITLMADKEAALATLYYTALADWSYPVELNELPLSYLWDEGKNADAFNMAVHVPGIVSWGDLPMLLALSNSEFHLSNVVSITGERISDDEWGTYVSWLKILKHKLNTNGKISRN
ncbi:alpha/beta hydrolase family protein [Sphingobacterium spiritivorum]|nr:acetylxylan esterase [Sphingobacterium spiritivorum]WQD34667.1 acetylxylan esterase [Sphingobacterium spiritivorum]SUI97664.1 Predicted dienelactone hydrolase [Sphingobacterium spiritivorum]